MNGNETNPTQAPELALPADFSHGSGGIFSGIGGAAGRLLRRRFVRPVIVVAAIVAIAGASWVVGGPSPFGSLMSGSAATAPEAQPGYVSNGTDTSGGATKGLTPALPETGTGTSSDGTGKGDAALISSLDASLIVRNGQVVLEVADVDKAVSAAGTAITALGGYVSDSNRSGIDQYVTASVTYRLPVAKWDAALQAVHGVGTKVLSEQTGSTDVTLQAIDLEARIANLKSTESALQAIMLRATDITDVIAVQAQLSQVQGEIESLSAQFTRIKDMAAMSTLVVTFQLPSQTVTTQATNEWTLGGQIDQALAALVRVAQGLATLGIWALIVALPIGIGLLILLAAWRLFRRGRRHDQPGTGITPVA
jgi:hypothetical protein